MLDASSRLMMGTSVGWSTNTDFKSFWLKTAGFMMLAFASVTVSITFWISVISILFLAKSSSYRWEVSTILFRSALMILLKVSVNSLILFWDGMLRYNMYENKV